MKKPSRKLISVTMRPDLYQAVKDAAAKQDVPVTAWVRSVVVAELQRIASL